MYFEGEAGGWWWDVRLKGDHPGLGRAGPDRGGWYCAHGLSVTPLCGTCVVFLLTRSVALGNSSRFGSILSKRTKVL